MDLTEKTRVLMQTDPFELLDEEVLRTLAGKMAVREYDTGTYVFRQGDASLDRLMVIASGLVEITVNNDRGVETVIGFRRPCDFFGETVVLSGERYPGAARVKEHLVCCEISRRDLENLIYNYPEFSGFFNALLAERMRLLYEQIVAEQSYEAYSQVESPLFRKRVSEVMSTPVVTCRTGDQAANAARLMAERDISSVVVLDRTNRPRGLLTERNLVRRLIADQLYPIHDCRVEHVMNSKLVQIGPEAFIGQALVFMNREKIRQLLVMERGKLVGIVTMVDLIKTRSTGTLLLTQNIEGQQTLDGLARLSREVDNVLNALIAEKASVGEIFEVMSELHERVARRVIQLCEEPMKMDGRGAPPVDYCWINMGSAARYEQTLRTDQDNAIIFADPPADQHRDVANYFARLAELIVEGLSACGFAKCTGKVMATEPKWRRPLSEWKAAVESWVGSYDPEDTRTLTILLDFRPIWGNMALAESFWKTIFSAFKDSITASHLLTKDDLKYDIPVNFLGNIVTEKSGPHKNQINLKTAGLVHIANCARILAIRHDIREPSTLGRLRQLVEKKVISAEDAELFQSSFETLMMFKIRENMKKFRQGSHPDNFIDPYALRKRERMLLKDALSGVAQLQKLINREFNVPWLKYFD